MTTKDKSQAPDALSEKRAADRAAMAGQVRALCAELHAGCTDRENPGPREIALEITHAGGARLWLDFDGDSVQPDTHVACWNIQHGHAARFSRIFGDVNTWHFRKSQFVARGFAALLQRLRLDLEMLNEGSAYAGPDTAPLTFPRLTSPHGARPPACMARDVKSRDSFPDMKNQNKKPLGADITPAGLSKTAGHKLAGYETIPAANKRAHEWTAHGAEIHDRPTHHDEHGARIGETPNRVCTVETFHPEEDAAFIVAACVTAAAVRSLVSPRQFFDLERNKDESPAEHVDRMLSLADQFLEDWEETAGESGDEDETDRQARSAAEWESLRPLLVASFERAAALEASLKRVLPWLGKMIADGGHKTSTLPYDAEQALAQADALLYGKAKP